MDSSYSKLINHNVWRCNHSQLATASGNPLLAINSLDLRSDGGFVEHSGIDSCFDVTMSSGLDITMDGMYFF